VSRDGARARVLLQPLRSRSFRLYWVGQATSAYGDQVLLVALAIQVLRLGGGRASWAWSTRRPAARWWCSCWSRGWWSTGCRAGP
jgi:hypothetical protein